MYIVFALFLFLFCSVQNTHGFLRNFLEDVGTFINGIEKLNQYNRKAAYDLAKAIIDKNKDAKQNGSNEPQDAPSQNSFFNALFTSKNESEVPYTFKNLAGTISEDVRELVDFLQNAEAFTKLGAQMPKGVLLVGPPGTGKTSIARAIAGEAQAHFFDATGSQFVEMFVGVGPQRVRELFNKARTATKNGPYTKAVIFIDEIDAIGGARHEGSNTEYRNTLNELLNQMDGFKQDGTILVLAATNTPDALDPALKRPGRFDRIVEIGLPTAQDREAILHLYSKSIAASSEISFSDIAQKTDGLSGAELKNIINEAAVLAARQKNNVVEQAHFEKATEQLMLKKQNEQSSLRRRYY